MGVETTWLQHTDAHGQQKRQTLRGVLSGMTDNLTFAMAAFIRPRAKQSVNYTTKKGKRIFYKTQSVRHYEDSLLAIAMQNPPARMLHGMLRVYLSFYFRAPKPTIGKTCPHTQKPDLDNLIKPVLDALKGRIFDDDSSIVYLRAEKHWHNMRNVIEILISEANP